MKVLIRDDEPVDVFDDDFHVPLKKHSEYVIHVPNSTPNPLAQSVDDLNSIIRRLHLAIRDARHTNVTHKSITAALFVKQVYDEVEPINTLSDQLTMIAAEHQISRIDLVYEILGVRH